MLLWKVECILTILHKTCEMCVTLTTVRVERHNANIIFFNKLLNEVATEVRVFGERRRLDHVHYWRKQPCTLVDLILQIVDNPMFKREIGILIVQYGRSENANNQPIGGHRAAQF